MSENKEYFSGSPYGPSQLTEGYRKTRRWYVFISALLLAYSLIGLQAFTTSTELPSQISQGSTDTPPTSVINDLKLQSNDFVFCPESLGNLCIRVLSPQAVPWVLFLLVLYFGHRIDVEWKLCPEDLHGFQATERDHWICNMLAATAIFIPFLQWFFTIQIADYFSSVGRERSILSLIFTLLTAGLFMGMLW